MFLPGARGGGVSTTQTKWWPTRERHHSLRKIRVILPENRRIVAGPGKAIDIHHTFPNQSHL